MIAHGRIAASLALVLVACVSALGCAEPAGDDVAQSEGAQSTGVAITKGTWDYLYPGREGLIRRLVLREDGSFEKTAWARVGGRLRQQKVSGVFTVATKQMPTFVRKLLKLRGANGDDLGTFRFREDANGELQVQPDQDEAARSTLKLMETAGGKKAAYVSCRATEVDYANSPFEESLSTDEYPDVDVYQKPGGDFTSVDIGGSVFRSEDGDQITVVTTTEGLEAVIDRGNDYVHVVRTNGTAGKILHREGGTEIEVATLACKRR